MSKPFYVYSTLTDSMNYTLYETRNNDLPVPVGVVHIAGGANLADRRLETPHGVVTKITEEQLAMLKRNPVFELHSKNGFIVVDSSGKERDANKVATDMTPRDEAAPLQDGDLPEGIEPPPPPAGKKK